uniref:Sulfotransferase n=1 Tax=Pundamilia nyererei TaxID=303518 RepID=A0A3B4FB38_9CICH
MGVQFMTGNTGTGSTLACGPLVAVLIGDIYIYILSQSLLYFIFPACLAWKPLKFIVYVARNPKDNAVSFYHFNRMNNAQPEAGEWRVFGSWYDHVNSWWEKKQSYSNLHYMFYEDLIEVWHTLCKNYL